MEENNTENNIESQVDITNDIERQEEKQVTAGNNKGIIKGICIGAISMLVISAFFVFYLSKYTDVFEKKTTQSIAIQPKTMKKADEFKNLINNYYYHPYKENNIQEYILKGMIAGLGDEYSVYYNKKETKEMMEDLGGEFCGIGAVLKINDDGLVEVIETYDDSPAKKAGIQPKDCIIGVDGKDITNQPLEKVVGKIKGDKGTEVTLTIARNSEQMKVKAKRDTINVKTVKYEIRDNNIGYISISEFASNSEEQFKTALEELKGKDVKGLIIDLRDNPGGDLDTVVNICDDIMPKGMVVYTKDKNGEKEEYKSKGNDKLDVPLVMLVNENSASASEIMTGAVKDRKIGTVVGTKTYGKGVVQQLFELEDDDMIKLTVSQYFTPKGKAINKKGIKPDIEVADSNEEDDKDEQLEKAMEVLKGKMQN